MLALAEDQNRGRTDVAGLMVVSTRAQCVAQTERLWHDSQESETLTVRAFLAELKRTIPPTGPLAGSPGRGNSLGRRRTGDARTGQFAGRFDRAALVTYGCVA